MVFVLSFISCSIFVVVFVNGMCFVLCRIAGTVSSAATCPLDVAKTRLQSSLIAAGHMQTQTTLNVSSGGLTATLHASLPQSQCRRSTVSIGFYHCIR